jgi:hypothetical protein
VLLEQVKQMMKNGDTRKYTDILADNAHANPNSSV